MQGLGLGLNGLGCNDLGLIGLGFKAQIVSEFNGLGYGFDALD